MPRSSRRRVFHVILILLFLGGALWAGISALAPSTIQRLLPKLQTQIEHRGIGLNEMSFSNVRVSPWLNVITLRAFHTRFDLNPRDDIRLQSTTNIEEVEVRLQNPFTLRGSARAEGLEVRFDPSDLPASMPYGRFTNGTLVIGDLLLARPRQLALEIREELKRLFIENVAVGDVQFSGDVKLQVEDEEIIAHLYTERQGEHFRLRFRDTDIANLSQRMKLDLAAEQLEIISRYPLRAPVLLLITDQARDFSRQHEPQDVWRRDAIRHVSWSFLLTKQFGAAFAKSVTDAQEMRPGNTPDERAMDFHNNAIGRRLFAEGEKLEALPQRVRQDLEIIRHPNEVETFREQRLLR